MFLQFLHRRKTIGIGSATMFEYRGGRGPRGLTIQLKSCCGSAEIVGGGNGN